MAYRRAHAAPKRHPDLDAGILGRRAFLSLLAVGSVAAGGLWWSEQAPGDQAAQGLPAPGPTASPAPAVGTAARPASITGPPRVAKVAPGPVVTGLPGHHNLLALTVDDGTDSAVVGAYAAFLAATGTRIPFFPNGDNPSWNEHAAA